MADSSPLPARLHLEEEIERIGHGAGFTTVAVALHDYAHGSAFSLRGERWFHAASTIKVAILLAVFRAVDEGRLRLSSHLHVRNRFRSIADDSVFRVGSDRDGDTALHRQLGRTASIADLSRAMIVRSSNLATNLLFDFLGREEIRRAIEHAGLPGLRVERGVEDEPAFERGLNNEVTAEGLLALFRLLHERRFLTEASCAGMLEILFAQEFNRMLPAPLPAGARVAHKTGEISTICHDAGLVFLPDRQPYALAILTEGPPNLDNRQKALASISAAVLHFVTDGKARKS